MTELVPSQMSELETRTDSEQQSCPHCGASNPKTAAGCGHCGATLISQGTPLQDRQVTDSVSQTAEPNQAGGIQVNPNQTSWSSVIMSGLASAVIAGLSAGLGSGKLTFGAWMVCYLLFLSWLKPFGRQVVAIAIMLLGGVLMAGIIRGTR